MYCEGCESFEEVFGVEHIVEDGEPCTIICYGCICDRRGETTVPGHIDEDYAEDYVL